MDWQKIHNILVFFQHAVSVTGILIILIGVIIAAVRYLKFLFTAELLVNTIVINTIRLNLGRTLILGLEFIVAADLIGTTTTPDYYSVGLLAIIVAIRTLLSFSINRELMLINREQ